MDEGEPDGTPIVVGYVQDEKQNSNALHRSNISECSKIGGPPAWIVPTSLPSPESLSCDYCKNPLMFLLQLYAPRGLNGFHRMLYVFLCWTCGKGARLFRCQLPQVNAYYPETIEGMSDFSRKFDEADLAIKQLVCKVCHLPVPNNQEIHLRCRNANLGMTRSCFRELKLFSALETLSHQPVDEDYEVQIVRSAKGAPRIEEVEDEDSNDGDDDDHHDPLFSQQDDPVLDAYIEHMNRQEPHVLRYGASEPIWFCQEGILPESDVPPCENCNAQRRFEFQIHSTILDYLNALDNLELSFGTLCCFTCSAGCVRNGFEATYVPEFIYRQRDPTLDRRVWRQL